MASLENRIFEILLVCHRYQLPTDKARYICEPGKTQSLICIHIDMLNAFRLRVTHLIDSLTERHYTMNQNRYSVWIFEQRSSYLEMKKILDSIGKNQKRLGLIREAEGKYKKDHIRKLWEIQRGRCYFSGNSLGDTFEKASFHIDHLVPVSKRSNNGDSGGSRGTNWPTNLALLDPLVNRLKGDDDSETFQKRVKENELFKLRSTSEINAIDQARTIAFSDYIAKNSSGR